jgi:hypothetical protein
MVLSQSLSRHGAHPPEGWRIRRVLFVLPLAVLLAPVMPIIALLVYAFFFPAYSASVVIPELQARVLLRFYYVQNDESGRHLTVATPRGDVTIGMTAFDWAHNSRTSIYLTPDSKLAVLGPAGDDYLVSFNPSPMNAGPPVGVESNEWVYLGAFDYDLSGGARTLRFLTAQEQGECIPMVGVATKATDTRPNARQSRCAHYRSTERQRLTAPL